MVHVLCLVLGTVSFILYNNPYIIVIITEHYVCYFFFNIFIYLAVLGFEPRALLLLGSPVCYLLCARHVHHFI
jgi:hypothetical protein